MDGWVQVCTNFQSNTSINDVSEVSIYAFLPLQIV